MLYHAWDPSGFLARAGLGFWGEWWPQGWSLQSPSSSTASRGSLVLLVPRRWQQTTALKPQSGDKPGMVGVPALWLLPPVSPEPTPGVTLPQEQAKEQVTSPAVIVGTAPGVASQRAVPSSTVPWVPHSQRGRGSCLVSILNPASTEGSHSPFLFPFPSQFLSD